jgi:hypothetical protein
MITIQCTYYRITYENLSEYAPCRTLWYRLVLVGQKVADVLPLLALRIHAGARRLQAVSLVKAKTNAYCKPRVLRLGLLCLLALLLLSVFLAAFLVDCTLQLLMLNIRTTWC